jgi:uncharacterized membrane protein YagU involved in acid resistance
MRTRPKHAALASVAAGGFIVGVLDLTYAIVVYSPRAPILIPQTIASGVLGAKSYQGGVSSAVLGVFLHFFIAFCIASVYYAASRKLSVLVTNALPSGLIYGGLVYCVMHGLVLPLSAVAHRAIPPVYVVTEFIEHWFFVGLPVALSVRYFSQDR